MYQKEFIIGDDGAENLENENNLGDQLYEMTKNISHEDFLLISSTKKDEIIKFVNQNDLGWKIDECLMTDAKCNKTALN